jgi:eukaryotic-like serine/threonine-protein kinase
MSKVERIWKWRFAAAPEALWPLLADTSRLNEAVGFTRYTLTETPLADGSIERIGSSRRFGMALTWEEGVPEWVWARRYQHTRRFRSRLVRAVGAEMQFHPASGGGSDVEFRLSFDAMWPTALGLRCGGIRRFGTMLDRLFREAAGFAAAGEAQGFSVPSTPVPDAVRRRVMAQARALGERGHAVAGRLATYILDAPEVELAGMRPRAVARGWQAAPRGLI